MMCKALLLAGVLALVAVANAVPITIDPKNCVQDFGLYTWSEKRFGPIITCLGGTVTFRWKGLHGVFQIPDAACPSNFTAPEADKYKFLAPTSQGGEYIWKTPNKTGHYWATSPYGGDCQRGMIAEVYVVDPENQEPFRASAMKISIVVALFLPVALMLQSLLRLL